MGEITTHFQKSQTLNIEQQYLLQTTFQIISVISSYYIPENYK
uniref:Uncharacterized protein n=1 Tax=Rhizophora mucronata TaxID=61149 RepID=A0A2P2PXK5_RHIMU